MTDLVLKTKECLDADEIILPEGDRYSDEIRTWAAHQNLRAQLVARPKFLQALSKLGGSRWTTKLDFSVRSGGMGSSSGSEVLISMTAFDSFDFNNTGEIITISAGDTWHQVDEKLAATAPGYAAISTRSSFEGVGGSIITGGISWISSKFGIDTDPGNLLDAKVVNADGTAL